MQEALKQAQLAYEVGEVPIGAVAIHEGKILAKAHNQVEKLHDCTAHAEMIVMTSLMADLGMKYLPDIMICVTVEPCVMCAGAMRWAQINTLCFGAHDPKYGYSLFGNLLHPKTQVFHGLFQSEIKKLMQNFFKQKRK